MPRPAQHEGAGGGIEDEGGAHAGRFPKGHFVVPRLAAVGSGCDADALARVGIRPGHEELPVAEGEGGARDAVLICRRGVGPSFEGRICRLHDVEAAAALGSLVRPGNIRVAGRIERQARLELRYLRWNRDQRRGIPGQAVRGDHGVQGTILVCPAQHQYLVGLVGERGSAIRLLLGFLRLLETAHGGLVHQPVDDCRCAELSKVAQVIARKVVLAAPQFRRDVLGVKGAEDARTNGLVCVAMVRVVGPEDASVRSCWVTVAGDQHETAGHAGRASSEFVGIQDVGSGSDCQTRSPPRQSE